MPSSRPPPRVPQLKNTASSRRRPPPRKPFKKKRAWIGFVFKGFLILSVWGLIFLGFALVWFTYDLPDVNKLQMPVRKPSLTVLSQDGHPIAAYGDLYEGVIRVEDLPPYVPQAVLAIEDRRFYSHFGLDFIGLIRAAYTNFRADRIVQGGSSITQQLSKNFLVTQGLYGIHDRSIRRKIQESLMAFWLEWHFSKQQILTIYLNRVYFGAGTYGLDAASLKYFSKSAKNLSVLEAAVLAGLLKAPSKYSPTHHPERALKRAKVVLRNMVEAGFLETIEPYIKEEQLLKLEKVTDAHQGSRFFSDWVYEMVPNYVPLDGRDLVVTTTLDLALQNAVETKALAQFESMAKSLNTSELGVVLMTPDGAIKAMVGGKDYTSNQYNHTAQALRQPGSAFKLFVYLAALEAGLSLNTMIEDTPVSIGKWHPRNFRRYQPQGEITLEEAFARSVNSASVRITAYVGPKRIAALAHRLGIISQIRHDLSISLGTCEVTLLDLTAAFATIANQGVGVWPYGILEIRDKEGQVLYRRQAPQEKILVAPRHVANMQRLLTAVVTKGTGRRAQIGVPIAGKTGSNGDRDAWFVGYVVGGLVAGVWTGNDNNKPMNKRSTGSLLPALIWKEAMSAVNLLQPPHKPPKPPSDIREDSNQVLIEHLASQVTELPAEESVDSPELAEVINTITDEEP